MMPATIQDRCAPYRADLDAAYAVHPEIPPGTLEAIGDRETLWGWAPEYRLADGTQAQGRPDGTGDWDVRWYASTHPLVMRGWARIIQRKSGPGSVAVLCAPADNLGWGRGLLSIDLAAQPEFCERECAGMHWRADVSTAHNLYVPRPAWICARCNIAYAADVLAAGLKGAGGYLPEAICAYNAGWGGVERARGRWATDRQSDGGGRTPVEHLDAVTTGGDYCSDVLLRREDFLRMCSAQPPATGKDASNG